MIDSGYSIDVMYVDIIGSCNLRCPSCPVAHVGPVNPTGLMDIDDFARIISWAYQEHGVRSVGLYNWAEPLLHPRLPEYIRLAKASGMSCHISSNLNVLRNPEELVQAEPDDFRISLSGFIQETYAITHAPGNIERVKRNMQILSDARERVGATNRIHVLYHKYKHNLDELPLMRAYATGLGFDWQEQWALYQGLERVFELLDGRLPLEEQRFIEEHFALSAREVVAALARLDVQRSCNLLERMIVVDWQGNLKLCCAVYDTNKHRLGAFVNMRREDVKRAKTGHPTCSRCVSYRLHLCDEVFYNQDLRRTLDEVALANVNNATRARLSVNLPVVNEYAANADCH
jgi:MoaA/NifB/PqqE/SkfB family radical SAM enzyme